MAVHHIKIMKSAFEPRSLTVKNGDQVHFQLSGREETATVEFKGERLDDEARFVVDKGGKQKTIHGAPINKTYSFSIRLSVSPEEMKVNEQTGTMNGSITVIP